MKSKTTTQTLILVVTALVAVAAGNTAWSQGTTAFTYQGQLNAGGAPATGLFDFRFAIFDLASSGTALAGPVTNGPVGVTNGLFTTTLDFGAAPFDGSDRWLDIAVRTTGGGAFTPLTPRQPVTPVPYALRAASFSGPVAASQLTGTIAPANIAAGSLTSAMLATGSVTRVQLAAGSVTTASLADGAVTLAKLNVSLDARLSTTFTNPTPANLDAFGISVAAVGADKVLIGAYQDDTGAANAGAAYLFSTGGALLTTFTNPTPAVSDFFGARVTAVGADKVLIGAYLDNTGAGDAGAAYLFSTDGTLLTTFTNPTPVASDSFGFCVTALGADKVLIGAYLDNTGATDAGAAYLFSTDGTLLTTFTNPTPAASDSFGYAVAAVGTDKVLIGASQDRTGAIGAGAAYLFSANGTLLRTFTNPTPVASDYFGYSVAALGADKVLIGARLDDTGAVNAGAAYLFSTNGTLLTTFTNPTPAVSDYFGASVAAVGADKVLIGAYEDDTGAANAGAAYLFSTNGTLLTTLTNPTPAASDFFGFCVTALGADQVLIGAHLDNTGATDAGAAYLFTLTGYYYVPGLAGDGAVAGSITAAALADGAVTATTIAPGAALANLQASGQSAVPSGGMILSSNANDANLAAAGYVKLGKVDLGDVWEESTPTATPAERAYHTAVWTGSEMIVWGGVDRFYRSLNTGKRYTPTAGTSMPVTTDGAPAARCRHTAVWTGSEMIVWGGSSSMFSDVTLNDSGRYDPVANRWTPVTTDGAPAARADHTAVWTGSEMIVWGGRDADSIFNTGGRYNPAANTWSYVAPGAEATIPSYSHTAVWTGSDMIIWHGKTIDGSFNHGGRYHPASDSWTPVTTDGAPSVIDDHTAVWTGREMIVWGKFWSDFDQDYFNDGRRYKPERDSWSAMTTAGAPVARGGHTAVWTGREMIVWGGHSVELGDFGELNDGGRYDPVADAWTAVTTEGAPVARGGHTAVWTGREMIVCRATYGSVVPGDAYSYTPVRTLYLYQRP